MPPKGKGRGRGRPDEQDRPQARDSHVGRGGGRNQQARPAGDVYQLPQHREQQSGFQGGASADFPSLSSAPRSQPSVTMPHPSESIDKPMAELTVKESKKKPAVSLPPDSSLIGFKQKPRAKFEMAVRPSPGTAGRKIPLVSNYYLLDFKDYSIYHYDVDIIFLRQCRKEEGGGEKKDKGAAAAAYEEPHHAKGKSLMEEGKTVKEAIKSKITHVEHQQKRAPGKKRCREIIAEWVKLKEFQKYSPVYDGQKNIYTAKPLPIKGEVKHEIDLNEEEKVKYFQIVIKPVEKQGGGNVISLEPLRQLGRKQRAGIIDMDLPQEVIMAFDTVMCHRNPPFDQMQVGRSFFLLDQKRYNLGNGMEIWFGYNQSVRLTERGPAVIINFSAKAFHMAGNVIDYACDVLGADITRDQLTPHQIKKLDEAISKVRIQVNHLRYKRKYIVKGVTKQSAKDLVVTIGENKISIAEYFRQKYNPLRFPFLPCLQMRSTSNTTYLPFEVCEIPEGQPVLGKLPPEATSKMIRQTAIPPAERFKEIERGAQTVSNKSKQTMNSFGLFMNLKALQLDGRVLVAPALGYGQGDRQKVAMPDFKGTWKMDGMQFVKSGDSPSYMIISFAKAHFCKLENLKRLNDILCRTARDCGMKLETAKDIKIYDARMRTFDALDHARRSGVTFAVVVISSRDYAHTYEEVKFIADVKLQLITQCLDEGTVVKKCNAQVATNVLLKVNSKIGGVNHILKQKPRIFSRPMIIFGADAAHSPRGFNCPSIASVVGSMDAYPSRYTVACRTQANTDENKLSQEIILDMKGMVREILCSFKNNTRGKYPEKIVFFRDGVSEGQFSQVLEQEVPSIQNACNEELNGNIPPITFIVVQKRHQTRFRPLREKDGVGRPGNIPPGTTVDTDVTHPVFFDFFLCSHEGIQGTSKPAHYTVLFDENKFSSDELQELCYHMCHTYVRCNRSISIPAPVMYAHLACARAKKYADLHSDTQSSASSGSGPRKLPQDVEDAITGMRDFQPGMFYV